MRTLLGGLLAALTVGVSVSAEDKKDEKIDAKKLVGKWVPKDKKKSRGVVSLEFTKDGKMTATLVVGGIETEHVGTYKVEGDKLNTVLRSGGTKMEGSPRISKLSDTEMVLAQEMHSETFIRMKEIDAKKLVGKWEPKEKEKGLTVVFEFTEDGKVSRTATNANGKVTKIEGTYKVNGDRIKMPMKYGDAVRTHTWTVSKLTDTELVSTDERDKEDTLVRIKDK
jgi:uncharacterized protein (TIGR03066 family)